MAYRVYGRVRRSDNGVGVPNLRVKAYDNDWISADDYLGSDITNSQGNFSITFERDAFDAGWFDPEGGPDVFLKIYNNQGRLMYRSEERGGAGRETYFDIRLNPLDLIGQYTVGGKVRDARSSRELCNLRVNAYDDDFLFDDSLGRDRTDHHGNYVIPYEKSDFSGWFEGNPDPYVKVRNDTGRVLAKSSTRHEAPRHSTINVNIGGQEIERRLSECIYGWTARYRQEGTHIIVRIELDPDAGIPDTTMATLRNTWKTGIENKWSNHFACRCTSSVCFRQGTLTFEVLWVNNSPHHTVRVRQGPARSNMTTWDTNDSGDVASHEFGHMIGLVDEYADAACPSRSPVNTGTVMDDNTEVVERHVEHLCELLNENAVPLMVVAELEAATKLKAMKAIFDLQEKERYAMCLRPDLGARKEIKIAIQEILDKRREMGKNDRITHTITGGVEGKRKVIKLEMSAMGEAVLEVDEQQTGKKGSYRALINARSVKNLFSDIIKSGLLDLTESGGPFIPDSDIGIITLDIGDETTKFYYLADPDQRRAQVAVMSPAIATIVGDLQRLAEVTLGRDEGLQKKIDKTTKGTKRDRKE
jgi:hypothetical protein